MLCCVALSNEAAKVMMWGLLVSVPEVRVNVNFTVPGFAASGSVKSKANVGGQQGDCFNWGCTRMGVAVAVSVTQ